MNYSDKLFAPGAASTIRCLTSEAEANGRDAIQAATKEQLAAALSPSGIIVENVFLKGIVLPKQLYFLFYFFLKIVKIGHNL